MKTGSLALGLIVALGVAASGREIRPGSCAEAVVSPAPPDAEVSKVLDQFHEAASKADEHEYFGLLTENAVFLGTDATERWTKAEFHAKYQPLFEKGQGWTYLPRPNARHVTVSKDGAVAWFDEVVDNAKYGECRGSGVLVRQDKEWKIAQYNLTVPVPNDLLNKVVEMIRAAKPAGAGKDKK